MAVTTLTFSFCCDLMALSFFCSLLSLASSSSCCLSAIAASSFATSSCWARHCCSYKHTCKYTPERNEKKKNRLLAITSCPERIAYRETTSWAPLPRCQRCWGCLSNFRLKQTQAAGPIKPLNHKGNLQVPRYKRRMLEIGIAHSSKSQKKKQFWLTHAASTRKKMIWICKFAKLKRIIMH